MRSMIPHKTAYLCFTVRRTFVNFFHSSPRSNESLTTPPPSAPFSDSAPQRISNLNLRRPLIDPKINGQHYDVAIVGGGSAGLSLANEAHKLGLKAILFDFVEPSPLGSKWGLGGTCPNVGCIPKKLMHTSALHFEHMMSAYDFGWNLNERNHYTEDETQVQKFQQEAFSWEKLVRNVQNHIKSTNFGYKTKLLEAETPYVNALATLVDKNTLLFSPKPNVIEGFVKSQELKPEDKDLYGKITADYIVLATGARPQYLNERECPNIKKFSITSDDIFSLASPPNKTLIVGGGYIALECAGMLSGMGYPVNIMTRAIYLRSFDRAIADMIMEDLQRFNKVKVIPTSLPYQIEANDNGKKLVKWKNQSKGSSEVGQDEFDTVLVAIGRIPNTRLLNLEKAGVKTHPQSKKIIGGFEKEAELTSVSNIYALGDVLESIPELTPVAGKSALLLARRLAMRKAGTQLSHNEQYKKHLMDYSFVPTTVFTPTEYSTCGLSEEKATAKYGADNLEIYQSKYTPTEEYLNSHLDSEGHGVQRKAFFKIICNKKDDERVVGIHYLGPNAGEIMQGLAVAMKLGVKKRDLDLTIGIHPTTAEEIVNLKVTKRSGEKFEKETC